MKRAHRLGQTKRVDLQVLVITGSYEDALLVRRGQLTQTGASLLPSAFLSPPPSLELTPVGLPPLLDFNKTKQPQGDSKLRDLLQVGLFRYLSPFPR